MFAIRDANKPSTVPHLARKFHTNPFLSKMNLHLLLIIILVSRLSITHLTTTDSGLPTPSIWWKAVCRGEKIDQAMRWSSPQAASFLSPLHSPWDSDLVKEFAQWGYTEQPRAEYCDFDDKRGLDVAFHSLGIDPRSTARGGANQCFGVTHGSYWKGPLSAQMYMVGGRVYRVRYTSLPAVCTALISI